MRIPLTAAMLEGGVFRQVGVAMPHPSRETYALHQFLEEIVLPRREPVVVAVFKRVWINGAGLHFVAIGSPTR